MSPWYRLESDISYWYFRGIEIPFMEWNSVDHDYYLISIRSPKLRSKIHGFELFYDQDVNYNAAFAKLIIE